jgi:hypothetical protein
MRERNSQQSQAGLTIGAGAEKLIRANRSRAKKYQRKRADKFSDELLRF